MDGGAVEAGMWRRFFSFLFLNSLYIVDTLINGSEVFRGGYPRYVCLPNPG